MKRLLIYVIILGIACWIGLTLKSNTGYVLISYRHFLLETSLWMAIILIVVVFYILFLILKFLRFMFMTHGHFRRWQQQQRLIKSHTTTGGGLLALVEADWENAETLLVKGLESSTIPVVNFIGAAQAASELGNIEKRDEYLQKARDCAEKDELIAVDLTEAKIYLRDKNALRAAELLAPLYRHYSRHRYILKLLIEAYTQLHDWKNIYNLMPDMIKLKILDDVALKELQLQTYQSLLSQAEDKKQLTRIWKDMPKPLRQDELLNNLYEQRKESFG